MTSMNRYTFRHGGAILREFLEQSNTSQIRQSRYCSDQFLDSPVGLVMLCCKNSLWMEPRRRNV